jgi:hypothetical protein
MLRPQSPEAEKIVNMVNSIFEEYKNKVTCTINDSDVSEKYAIMECAEAEKEAFIENLIKGQTAELVVLEVVWTENADLLEDMSQSLPPVIMKAVKHKEGEYSITVYWYDGSNDGDCTKEYIIN